jgi:predicted adenine nucleotide alpha hydrolase (AANH) superfamily ATPase
MRPVSTSPRNTGRRNFSMPSGTGDLPEAACGAEVYRLRREETARRARVLGCDYFETTFQSARIRRRGVNRIGEELAGANSA